MILGYKKQEEMEEVKEERKRKKIVCGYISLQLQYKIMGKNHILVFQNDTLPGVKGKKQGTRRDTGRILNVSVEF